MMHLFNFLHNYFEHDSAGVLLCSEILAAFCPMHHYLRYGVQYEYEYVLFMYQFIQLLHHAGAITPYPQ